MKSLLIATLLLASVSFASAQDGPTEDCAECTEHVFASFARLSGYMDYVEATGDVPFRWIEESADDYLWWSLETQHRCAGQLVDPYRVTNEMIAEAIEFRIWLIAEFQGCETERGCDIYWR